MRRCSGVIPSSGEWTIILSRQANAWGSFAYDPKADFLRVKTTPTPSAESQERLLYTFETPTEDSVMATLRGARNIAGAPKGSSGSGTHTDSSFRASVCFSGSGW